MRPEGPAEAIRWIDHRSVQRLLQPELAAGIYLYRLTSDGEILTHGKGYLR